MNNQGQQTPIIRSPLTFITQRKTAMSHAGYILSQSIDFDKNSIVNKFSKMLDDILTQLKAEHLDRVVVSATKYVPHESRIDLIDGIIKGRCKTLRLSDKTIAAGLTINEQFYILSHTNLGTIIPRGEDQNPIFANLVHILIRNALFQ